MIRGARSTDRKGETVTHEGERILATPLRRRDLLKYTGIAALLAACKKAEPSGSRAAAATHPPIGQEPGGLRVFDWAGYGDGSYYPKKERAAFWQTYVKQTGDTPRFTLFEDDDQGYSKAATGAVTFDVVHPCAYRWGDWHALGVLQPWDTKLIPNFPDLNPTLEKVGVFDGKQLFVASDWGFAAPMYRADQVDPGGEVSWGLLFDDSYKGKIAWWDSLNMFVVTGYYQGVDDPWDMTDDELGQLRDFLISKKPLVRFMWGVSYDLFRSFKQGEVNIGYAWPDAWVYSHNAGLDVVYPQPKEGRTSWFCGFGLSKDSQNYFHAHDYVNSWTSTKAGEFLLNYYAYGHANTSIDLSKIDPTIVKAFSLDDPTVLDEPRSHVERPIRRRATYQEYWDQVKAA
jgi:spermidine/putrescine transport system substrate-binding protein